MCLSQILECYFLGLFIDVLYFFVDFEKNISFIILFFLAYRLQLIIIADALLNSLDRYKFDEIYFYRFTFRIIF